MNRIPLLFPSVLLYAIVFLFAAPKISHAQISPGPYEILPFQDGFIVEAFNDLITNSASIADWSGYSGSIWTSPNPYNNHIGSDFSVQTGTPLFAAAAGTVTQIATNFARNEYNNTGIGYYGNFVRIAVDAQTPNGDNIDLIYAHMLQVSVTVGQHVNVGTPVGLSDNNGNSTTEHVHFQTEIRGALQTCPFYWAHCKYPIMFNPTGTMQVGRVIRITTNSTPIRSDRFDTNAIISTAHSNQLYFCSYPKRGYYQVFIPNNASFRSGWIKATAAEELFTGTVIQTLPDNVVSYAPLGQLSVKHSIRSSPDDAASQIGQLVFGGGRFVADQITNGYYRIPFPGATATWGWVKANNRMVVYPQLTNPALNLNTLPNNNFPLQNSFTTTNGNSMFGRPKFNRSVVTNAPGGSKGLFVTDATNAGDGTCESVTVGKPGHANYFVQCDVYFNYRPAYLVNNPGGGYERYGIFMRDDGFAGLDTTFEGAGNAYVFLWDADDGRLRAGKSIDGTVTDFQSAPNYFTTAGWHTLRIEARGTQLKYFLDGNLLIQQTDTSFTSGPCGVGYSQHFSGYPAGRGAYFDNFFADTLDITPPLFTEINRTSNGFRLLLTGDPGSTNAVERTATLTNWSFFTNIINTNGTASFLDPDTSAPVRFYRAKRLQ